MGAEDEFERFGVTEGVPVADGAVLAFFVDFFYRVPVAGVVLIFFLGFKVRC